MVLEEVSREEVAASVRLALENIEEGVRKAASEVLADLGDHNALASMIDAALTNHGALAKPMARSLKKLDLQQSTEQLLSRLSSLPESCDRRFVIEMLEDLFRPEQIPLEPPAAVA